MKDQKLIKLRLLERIQVTSCGTNHDPGEIIDYPLSDWEKIPQQYRTFAVPFKE